MTISRRALGVLFGSAGLVTACQPALHPVVPSGAAAYDQLAVSESDTVSALTLLQARDQITVKVFGEDNLTTENATIDQAGNVSLPLIGEVHVAGLSPAQLSRVIEQAYGKSYLRDPHVNVVLVKGAPRVLSVEGEVRQPGVFEVQDGYTLLSALALAGSPTETAKLNQVLIFRQKDGQRVGGVFDLVAIRSGRAPDPLVIPGDVIVVGYNRVRGGYLDFLKTAPVIGAFSRY
jgi:polysaccharide export outer membrane protein